MSDDSTKDESFNQLYAGRSRTRRDLNTIKRELINAKTPHADRSLRRTWYDHHETFGGETRVRVARALLGSMGPAYQQLDGMDISGVNPPHRAVSWAELTDAEAHICVWRGMRDSLPESQTGKPAQEDIDIATEGIIQLHQVRLFLAFPFTTSGTPTSIYAEVGVGGNTGLIQPLDYGNTCASMIQSPGGNVIDLMDATNEGGVFPGTTAGNQPMVAMTAQAGGLVQFCQQPAWQDTAFEGEGGVNSAGVVHLGSTYNEVDVGSPSSLGSAFSSGVYIKLVGGGGGTLADITGGGLFVTIYYTHEPRTDANEE